MNIPIPPILLTAMVNLFNSKNNEAEEKILSILNALKVSGSKNSEKLEVFGTTLSEVLGSLKSIESRLEKIEAAQKLLLDSQKAQDDAPAHTGGSDRTQWPKSQAAESRSVTSAPKPEPPKPQKIYAVMVGPNKLAQVDESRKDQAQFVLKVTGGSGKVSFNGESEGFCLQNLESKLLPYFECDLLSTSPSSIKAQNDSNVSQSGSYWVMDKPIKLIIS